VSPGPILVEGRKWDSLRERRRAIFERDRDAHPMKRMGTAQEVANMVAVLASPAASWVNGEHVVVEVATPSASDSEDSGMRRRRGLVDTTPRPDAGRPCECL